jgi:hypothetical protein
LSCLLSDFSRVVTSQFAKSRMPIVSQKQEGQ